MIWGILIFSALFILAGLKREIRKHGIHVLAFRWLAGTELNGQSKTNAGFLRRADRIHHHSGHASKWAHAPRLHRSAIRTGATAAVIATVYGLIVARGVTVLVLAIAGSLTLILAAVLGIRAGRKLLFNRAVISPLAEGLAPMLGIPPVETQRAVTLPANFHTITRGKVGSIQLPPAFTASESERASVEHLISNRLPGSELEYTWKTKRTPMTVEFSAASRPPAKVAFASLRAEMEACPKGTVVLGIGRKDQVKRGSFIADDCHWGFAVGSGMGKTTFLLSVASQILHNDPQAKACLIDPKMSGATALAGVPGVTVSADPGDPGHMAASIEAFHAEMMRRLYEQKSDPTLEFPMNVLFLDELPTFSVIIKNYWDKMRQPSDRATWKGWSDLIGPILWTGRSVSCHAVFFGQQLYERNLGGIGVRPSLGLRGIAPVNARVWDMLVGSRPVPSDKGHKFKGRWLFSIPGDEPFWVQTSFAEFAEFRDYAMENRINLEKGINNHVRTVV